MENYFETLEHTNQELATVCCLRRFLVKTFILNKFNLNTSETMDLENCDSNNTLFLFAE